MARLCAMKSSDPLVKKNRNEFFQYLLQMMNLYVQRQKANAPKEDEAEAETEKDKKGVPFSESNGTHLMFF